MPEFLLIQEVPLDEVRIVPPLPTVTKSPFSMHLSAGARLSLWPITPVKFAASSGLVWPVDGLTLAPDGQVATSNKMKEDWLSVTPHKKFEGVYAICCAPEFLPQMITAAAKT